MGTLPAFNILISYDALEELWEAHCLEMDLLETGETRLEAIQNLFKIIPVQIEESIKAGIHYLHPAPLEAFQLLEKATPISIEEITQECFIPFIPSSIFLGEVSRNVH